MDVVLQRKRFHSPEVLKTSTMFFVVVVLLETEADRLILVGNDSVFSE